MLRPRLLSLPATTFTCPASTSISSPASRPARCSIRPRAHLTFTTLTRTEKRFLPTRLWQPRNLPQRKSRVSGSGQPACPDAPILHRLQGRPSALASARESWILGWHVKSAPLPFPL